MKKKGLIIATVALAMFPTYGASQIVSRKHCK